MPIEVTDELVRQVARLSRLALSREAERELKTHFQKVLAFVESLQELDTTGIDPSHFSVEASNVFRADEVKESLPVERGLSNAPQTRGSSFVVPSIIGDSDEHEGA